jgi:hypothetical protein
MKFVINTEKFGKITASSECSKGENNVMRV